MKVLLPDQLAYHAYIIQAAALASAEHFYSQNGGKRAAASQGKIARKRICRRQGNIPFDENRLQDP